MNTARRVLLGAALAALVLAPLGVVAGLVAAPAAKTVCLVATLVWFAAGAPALTRD
jgi:hypothetical protein